MKLAPLVAKAKKLTAIRAAAVDTIRPVRERPCVTASAVLAPSPARAGAPRHRPAL